MSCNSCSRSHRSLRTVQIRGFAILEVNCPRKDFDAFWSQFLVFVEVYTLAKPTVHSCMVFFQTFEALGLPMCHIFTVSGSSLPVLIAIRRWADQINLQAEVRISGTIAPSHMVGREYQRMMPYNFIQSVYSACRCHFFKDTGSLIPLHPFGFREATQIKLQAMVIEAPLKTLRTTVSKMADDWKNWREEEACLCPLNCMGG